MTLSEKATPVPTPLLSPRYRWATVGMVSLIFLAAFEALAVTTIMPTVSRELDGRAWFSAAFSVTLAASVVINLDPPLGSLGAGLGLWGALLALRGNL